MKTISTALLDELTAKAAASPRRRAHFNLHASADDPVQRFIVVAQRNSYVRPHRHMSNAELAVVMRGRFEVVTFDAEGTITTRQIFGEGTPNLAFELPHATWHTLLPLADGSAFLEIKQGPYNPAIAAEFATWAPEESNSAATSFQNWIGTAPVGARWPQ